MKLTIKTLQNSTFKVEIDPDKSVKELKETIEKEQGKDYPSASQKLIYNGKILADENPLSEYQFDEKKFVVLMITRPPPLPKPSVTQDTTSSNKQKNEAEAVKPKTTMATPTTTSTSTTTATTTTTAPTPSRQSQTSTQTVSSTTATTTSATPVTATSTQQPTSANRATNYSDTSMNDTQTRLASLMRQAQFRQMQDMIQQNPHLLSSTIESLAASDPEMYTFISENPDVFVNALNHPPMADLRSGQQSSAPRTTTQGRDGSVQQPGGQRPAVEHLLVNVSEHDKEAIERLKELGFSEYLAVQAYMACDKDEQLAANLLFQMEQ